MRARSLTDDCLEPFAALLRCNGGQRTPYPIVTQDGGVEGRLVFSVMTHQPVVGEILVTRLERHPHSSQSFFPIKSGRWLIVVAPDGPGGEPDLDRAKAFIAGPGDAICYAPNVWHAGLMVLDRPAEMGMMMWCAANDEDTVFHALPSPLSITI